MRKPGKKEARTIIIKSKQCGRPLSSMVVDMKMRFYEESRKRTKN